MVARNPVAPRALKPMDLEKEKSKQKDDESPIRMTIEEIFKDYLGRRNGLRRALTTEWLDLYEQCDPDIDDALCLCGYPNETWDLDVPSGSLKSLPPPSSGVNFARDEKNWLYSVAQHSDVWLIAVALYLAAKSEFDRDMREKLFIRINKLTPLSETVREEAKKRSEEKTPQLESHIGVKRKPEEGSSAPKAKLLKPEQAKIKKKAKEKTLFEMVLGKIAKENQDSSGSTDKTNPDNISEV